MNKSLLNSSLSRKSKIALGTVQFGLKYGINNKSGIINDKDLSLLLSYAAQNAIDTIDTAYSYGNSEERLGNEEISKNFNVISKAPRGSCQDNLISYFRESIGRLKVDSIYGYLLHDFNDYLNDKNIVASLNELKKNNLVKKTGFSLYFPEQLEKILEDEIIFDLIQIPYNLVDKRFFPYFNELKHRKVEIHVRSVFLQGLFFLNKNELSKNLEPFTCFLEKLHSLAGQINRSIENIALNFVLQNELIDKAVIGVDTTSQIGKNLKESQNPLSENEYNLINNELSKINIPDQLLIPSNWT